MYQYLKQKIMIRKKLSRFSLSSILSVGLMVGVASACNNPAAESEESTEEPMEMEESTETETNEHPSGGNEHPSSGDVQESDALPAGDSLEGEATSGDEHPSGGGSEHPN